MIKYHGTSDLVIFTTVSGEDTLDNNTSGTVETKCFPDNDRYFSVKKCKNTMHLSSVNEGTLESSSLSLSPDFVLFW